MRILMPTAGRPLYRVLIAILILGTLSSIVAKADEVLTPRELAAQTSCNGSPCETYRSDALGLAFQYPAAWELREQDNTKVVMVGAKSDFEAISASQKPQGLLFSVAVSTFRQIGVESPDQFGAVLSRMVSSGSMGAGSPQPVRIGGVDGLALDSQDAQQDVAARMVLLSAGQRRVVVAYGVATLTAWKAEAQAQFEQIINSMTFFTPANHANIDNIGVLLWRTALTSDNNQSNQPVDIIDIIDIGLNNDESMLYVSQESQGIWQVGANGVLGSLSAWPEIGSYAGLSVIRDDSLYVADPLNHTLWVISADRTQIRKLAGGQLGTARGTFGMGYPRFFAFGLEGTLYVLDVNEETTRVQIFSRGGAAMTYWDMKNYFPEKIANPLITSDVNGNAYILGSNTNGIIKLNAGGGLTRAEIGKQALGSALPLALAIDRFGNLYVATGDQGILQLDRDGNLLGVIGEAYDQAAPPKDGQLGRPTAMILTDDGSTLYVVDGGKYPQVLAYSLDNSHAISLEAGTLAAGPINYGETKQDSITATTFVYDYTFTGTAGDVVTITVQAAGDTLDAFVEVLDNAGQRLASNDDAGLTELRSTDAQIKDFHLPYNGTYTVRVTRFGRETATTMTGQFSLKLEKSK